MLTTAVLFVCASGVWCVYWRATFCRAASAPRLTAMQAQSKRSEEDEAFEAFNVAKGGKATQWWHPLRFVVSHSLHACGGG